VSNVSDSDLMMLADGELDATEASAIERRAGRAGARKVEGIQEVGGLVRGHLELSTDEAEDRLAGLWSLVERRIEADARAEATPAPAAAAPAAGEPAGMWARFTRWLDGHRGHFLTGALSAGAVALLALVLRDPEVVVKTVQVPGPTPSGPVAGGPVTGPIVATPALQRTAPEIESLEVSGGTGSVFTIQDDDGGDIAVIWVTPDDVLEGI
jgi:hypothetical protein